MLQNFTLGSFAQGVSAGAGAFESIASVTASGSSNTITFSSIPNTYKHLQIRFIGRSTGAGTYAEGVFFRCNSDSGTNYSQHFLRGFYTTASGVAASGGASQTYGAIANAALPLTGNNANIVGAGIIDIHDYASTTKTKTFRTFYGYDANGVGEVGMASGLWNSTSAITSITLYEGSISTFWGSNSVIALYGIKGA